MEYATEYWFFIRAKGNLFFETRLKSICILVSMLCCGFHLSAQQTLLSNADFSTLRDSQGFEWDIEQTGAVNSHNSSSLNSTMKMNIIGSRFYSNMSKMTPDRSLYVLNSNRYQRQQMTVTRRIYLDRKNCFLRYADVIQNTGTQVKTVAVEYQIGLYNNCESFIDRKGKVFTSGQASDKLYALACIRGQGSNTPGVLLYFGKIVKGVTRNISIQNKSSLTPTHSITIPPGEKKVIVTGLAQRHLKSIPSKKELQKLLSPFNKTNFLKNIPKDLRKHIVAGKRSGGVDYGIASIEDLLGEERGISDIMAIGDETKLRGVGSCVEFTVKNRFGTSTVPFLDIAAILGGKKFGDQAAVYLRDGQVLRGKAGGKDLRFQMNCGLNMDLKVKDIDRLLTHVEQNDGVPPANAWMYLELFSNDRLAIRKSDMPPLKILTSWGSREVPFDMVASIYFEAEDTVAYRVALKDGSRFIGMLGNESLKFNTLMFGIQEFKTYEIKSLIQVTRNTKNRSEPAPKSHIVLAGDTIFVGQIDLPSLEFNVVNETVPIPPNQIRLLEYQGFEDDPALSDSSRFKAELWGGDVVDGTLMLKYIPLRNAEWTSLVPVSDILSVSVAQPTASPKLRSRISELIRMLGDVHWKKREQASKQLEELGVMAKGQLADTLLHTKDEEMRERVQVLIDKIPSS